ncbi:hypothetical protein ACIBFB_25905 [Nocardiopsis sp. NPDC050513]|uniref:hypothetical protein n=1 Tax=Nocardiopsis sp. NPDC050513 TaxID=3364338 RepID=UPI003791702C
MTNPPPGGGAWRAILAWLRAPSTSGAHTAPGEDDAFGQPGQPAFGHAERDASRSPYRVYHDGQHDVVRISSPARGEGYHFEVEVRCDWVGEATILDEDLYLPTYTALDREIRDLRADIEERVAREVRPVTRRFAPHRAAEVEHALPSHLAGCFNEGRVQCHPRVTVDVCDPVRAMLAEKSDALIRLDADGWYQEARIEQLRTLRARWEELFLDALRGAGEIDTARATWLAPYALRLAESPANATHQLERLLRKRESQAEELFRHLESMIDGHAQGDVDHVAFMLDSDHALRQMFVTLGLPVPEETGSEPSPNGARP